MSYENYNLKEFKSTDLKKELLRYFSFYPFFLISLLFCISSVFLILRYTNFKYESNARIEIIDDAMDSEMALPSAMTIFNRSMVNLENEIGVLTSYRLHEKVVKKLNSNINYYSKGRIKTTQNHFSEWFDEYSLDFNIDTNKIVEKLIFEFSFENGKMEISSFDQNEDLLMKYNFENMTTKDVSHNLPFEITIYDDLSQKEFTSKKLILRPLSNVVMYFQEEVKVKEHGKESDQLDLTFRYFNKLISNEYIDALIFEFDIDGINDRRDVYKRTIDFVDSRFGSLAEDLRTIEIRKQEYKEENSLSDLKSDAEVNITQQLAYNSELFNAMSQLDLIQLLDSSIDYDSFSLLPVNIGIENSEINKLIFEYNLIFKDRERVVNTAGPKNAYVLNINSQLSNFLQNIKTSINNYEKSLKLTINNLELKEKEFENIYSSIPSVEKTLRAIERELEIKESLFLLLMQKREEAAINNAVVKPSIKVVDKSRSSIEPVSPNALLYYFVALILGFLIPFIFLYLRFYFDNKIHTKEQVIEQLPDLPVIGEIPYIENKTILNSVISNFGSRNILSESLRMVIANLNFSLFNDNVDKNNLILVTSTIKGEGKTIISVNIASLLSAKYKKVLLIGSDLRNPQIHKLIEEKRNNLGLSDYIYRDDLDWKKLLIKKNNLEIMLSGNIPPNPTELLASKKFEKFINEIKNTYDYIVIDSAPCLLVSDTLEISKYADTTLYVMRSNYSDKKLCEFIKECSDERKLNNLNIVINSVGNSSYYGYKYGYQYGYKYGYKYGYNYGYGYGYEKD